MTNNPVKPVREGFHTVTLYLITSDVDGLIAFIQRAFDGVETFRTIGSAGGTHVEVRLGDSMLMLGGNAQTSPMPCMIHLYLPDVDRYYQRALAAGATSVAEPTNFPDGDRRGGVQDPFGNQWYISAPHAGWLSSSLTNAPSLCLQRLTPDVASSTLNSYSPTLLYAYGAHIIAPHSSTNSSKASS